MKYSLKSRYVRFAVKYCELKGLYTSNEVDKRHVYADEDIWEGILLMRDYEYRNRKGK
jgi:hypothetical protein